MQEKDFPEQDALVLCTVDRIIGTTVFVKIDEYNKEGVISMSEIAPGRIRNIRDYVKPGKRIVCKVLRVHRETGHIDLSLRRVSLKERTKVISDFEREKDISTIIKAVLKERAEEAISKIKSEHENISSFLENASPADLKNLGFSESETEQLLKIVKEKPQRRVSVKAKLSISNEASDGLTRIKQMILKALQNHKDTDISYISSPNYSITVTSSDYKEANRELDAILEEIANEAKINGCKIEAIR
jgi:translation initiation factor 2 subunit 1